MATKMTDGTDAPQEKEHAVRLLSSSPDDIFAAADFKEILSPMVEPEDVWCCHGSVPVSFEQYLL